MKATKENLERHRATRPDAAQALGELTAFARREGAALTAAMGAAFAAIRDRREEKCTYRPALLDWAMLGMFLFRRSSVNALDAQHPVGSAHPSWLREVSGLSPEEATGRLVVARNGARGAPATGKRGKRGLSRRHAAATGRWFGIRGGDFSDLTPKKSGHRMKRRV